MRLRLEIKQGEFIRSVLRDAGADGIVYITAARTAPWSASFVNGVCQYGRLNYAMRQKETISVTGLMLKM